MMQYVTDLHLKWKSIYESQTELAYKRSKKYVQNKRFNSLELHKLNFSKVDTNSSLIASL